VLARILRDGGILPLCPVDSSVARLIGDLGFKAIMVSYHEILERRLFDRVSSGGINSVLDFDGDVFLSSIMPDELLLYPGTFHDFVRLLDSGGFAGSVVWDMPVEVDIPLEVSWSNLRTSIERVESLKEYGFSIIPLLKGANREQMHYCVDRLKDLGFKEAALHATEYVLCYDELLAQRLFTMFLVALCENFDRGLVIGVLNPKSYRIIESHYGLQWRDKLVLSGRGWWLSAVKHRLFWRGGSVDLMKYSVRCYCRECRGRILDHRSSVEELASHNLQLLREMVGREVFSSKSAHIEKYDVYLRGRILVVSDLHIGTVESMLDEFICMLEEIKPDYVVFVGDTFDLVRGKLALYHLMKFFASLHRTGVEVVPVLGDAEGGGYSKRDRLLLDSLYRILLVDEGWTSPHVRMYALDWYMVWFMKFCRSMRKEVSAILPCGRRVFFVHGHEWGTDLEYVKKRARLRGARLGDWVILGHLHKFHVDKEMGVIVCGCWQRATESMERRGFTPDTGTALLINSDGDVELMEYGSVQA